MKDKIIAFRSIDRLENYRANYIIANRENVLSTNTNIIELKNKQLIRLVVVRVAIQGLEKTRGLHNHIVDFSDIDSQINELKTNIKMDKLILRQR